MAVEIVPVENVPVEIVEVGWDDARAVALRAEMDAWLVERYRGSELTAEQHAALALDPADVVLTLLALRDGTAVGHGALRQLRGDLEVKRLVVAGTARGRGVATTVMTALEDRARARGARRLLLNTGDRQHEAVRLYGKLGYAPIAHYPPYDAIPASRSFAKRL